MSALVLLHGFTGSPATFDALRGGLGAQRPLLAPWLAGHGPDPVECASFRDEVARLGALVADFGRGPVHLLGYSLGARLALALTLWHPELVAVATLVGAHAGLASEAERAARRAADAAWVARLEPGDLAAFVAEWERQPLFASQAALAREEREALRRERLGHLPRGLAGALRGLGLGAMPDLGPSLATSRTPLDLVVGELDERFRAQAARIARERPDARLHVVPGVGHNVPRESPLALARLLSEESSA